MTRLVPTPSRLHALPLLVGLLLPLLGAAAQSTDAPAEMLSPALAAPPRPTPTPLTVPPSAEPSGLSAPASAAPTEQKVGNPESRDASAEQKVGNPETADAPAEQKVGNPESRDAPSDPNAWSALPRAGASDEPTAPADATSADASAEDANLLPPGLEAVGDGAAAAPMTPSQNVTINLINRLVQRGVLTKEDAADLIQQAELDAQMAQAQAAATQEAVAQAAAAAQQAVANTPPPPEDDGSVRVTYIPAIVKTQISDQVKDEVMAQARAEGWAAPKLIPSWLPNFRPFADIRVRYEGDYFPDGNDASGAFPNFNAINTGAPFNVAGDQFSPQYNVDQDRQRIRLRARFGADLNLGENFTSGVRIATGDSNSPVSANQSLGLPYEGQGGNFSKYAIWLDRAFIRYEYGGEPTKNVSLVVGRFDNPFFTTSQIMWDDDIGFDGVALQAKYEIFRGFTPFLAGGVFPVYNTDFNFSSNQPQKFKSYDKWLYAIQGGTDWKITKDLQFKTGLAYYYFDNVEGQLSSPYTPLSASDAGDTDASRPSFAQKGNTYMALRNIVPNASNDFGATNQWQYYGLATPFRNLAFNAKLDYKIFEPYVISVSGEWVQNLAFNGGDIDGKAVNNRGAIDDDLSDSVGDFVGGDSAWIVQMQVGSAALDKFGAWQIFGGYRYVESDSVIDGFNDSDFGGGGTNLEGYTLGGNLALSKNVYFGIRWLSAQSIAGPTYQEDIIQFDLNAKF